MYNYLGSMRMASRICKVSIASICRWSKCVTPATRHRSHKLSDAIVASVAAFMQSSTRFSSLQVVKFLQENWKINASRQLAHSIIRRLGFTFKRTRHRGKRTTTSPQSALDFRQRFSQAFVQGTLVAIDESGFDQRCRPVYGYAPSGTQAIVTIPPCSDRRRYNLLMAIHQSGNRSCHLSASTTTSQSFADFIRILQFPKGTTILLDNAAIHKAACVHKAAREKGYEFLFTPPYSPEFNPIEMMFGVIKRRFYHYRYTDSFRARNMLDAITHCIDNSATCHAIQGCFRHVSHLLKP